jgi:hypothetical protein
MTGAEIGGWIAIGYALGFYLRGWIQRKEFQAFAEAEQKSALDRVLNCQAECEERIKHIEAAHQEFVDFCMKVGVGVQR